jgi:enamine deaminase RidA (YjgF/YER057c/UK114 family)
MHHPHTPSAVGLSVLTPHPPAWVATLVGAAPLSRLDTCDGVTGTVASGDHFTHVHVLVPRADALSPDVLATRVREAYLLVADTLTRERRHPLRFWNFVPHIHTPSGEGIDRYMVFNSGRFAACEHWLGSAREFDHTLAAASGVGIVGPDLAIHCLAADAPGHPVENPRQVPAYRYSTRFGPRPPCFARATRITRPIADAWWLLVAGTASICGEDTAFVGDVERQTSETFANLDALLVAAQQSHAADLPSGRVSRPARFTSLRVYVVHEGDLGTVQDMIHDRYPDVDDVEFAKADLCRADLLVEIEGVAEL